MSPCSTGNPTSQTVASLTNSISISIFVLLLITSSAQCHAAYSGRGRHSRMVRKYLAPHNAARAAVRMPLLRWDSRLENYARWSAYQRRYDCALQHSNGSYGENIFWGSGNDWKPAQAVAAWLSEKIWYDYWSNSCVGGNDCGHYTQIVWGRTSRIGCARVVCVGGQGVFITCNYDPPGTSDTCLAEAPYTSALVLEKVPKGYTVSMSTCAKYADQLVHGRNTTGTYVSEVHGWTLLDVVGMLLGMMEHAWNDEVKSTARRMLP
ncbi:pathogenesis-related protein PR-1-like [Mangifera indica]|uniref:pathogenesis-related protein PR-1-like n=1 Tax=Mangifera indica TaxID=29780 RepID=UPI001CFC227A|nr:pathogenesis-related protein PR-1-like [Mangifera indica]